MNFGWSCGESARRLRSDAPEVARPARLFRRKPQRWAGCGRNAMGLRAMSAGTRCVRV